MTLQDWMNRSTTKRPTMTETPEPTPPPAQEPKRNPWTTAPDHEWLAEWAMIALSSGRIEMGYQLSRLAVMAHRYLYQQPQHAAADLPATGHAPVPAPDQTAILRPADPILNGRCSHRLAGGRECFGVAMYDPIGQAWVHLEDDLDRDHVPVVPPNELYGQVEGQS